MQTIVVESKERGAEKVVELVREEMEAGRLNVLGLATGSTMEPVYEKMVASDLDFTNVTAFNLDEYIGIPATHKNSYAYYMDQLLFNKKPFKETHIENGMAEDLDAECVRYETLLKENPLDMQFLGIGENGHIAFNEPGTSPESVTHVVELTQSTIDVNSQYFTADETMPVTALTMGISSIMQAKKLIVAAFGEKKRAALEKLFAGEVTTEWPVTYLLDHPDVTVITDLKL
ncbi:glucosamine-6-phosphate deaminase [Sporosarcina aquimarina]|uniref:Glucosamine-6-phosphate deaminase n=1 Tax=Sporosarcina aquimarina TaxID=114975 RepID=A0ABU4G1D2_9BACL|nr:glucosamine-6-phosphate deaminase [Sporosarcina aquimarina]MDW0110773.1 glucosamine-6-phosphate deaminase [Sporosarcina aquimarina]